MSFLRDINSFSYNFLIRFKSRDHTLLDIYSKSQFYDEMLVNTMTSLDEMEIDDVM